LHLRFHASDVGGETFGGLPDQWVVVSQRWNIFVSHMLRSQRTAGSCARRRVVAEGIADSLGRRENRNVSLPNFWRHTMMKKQIAGTSFVSELWAFMRERKKWWLGPIVVVLVLFGTLVALTQGSAVAPFIYTIF
jgi:Family of unknown function (DUF5989)